MPNGEMPWDEHGHDAMVHSHPHHHITHNFNKLTGGFDHLGSMHEHEHDHAPLNHGHYPHQDFMAEHQGEAHDHDHGEPVRKRAPAKKAAQKATAKKATAKKADSSE